MTALMTELLAHKNTIQKVRQLNFENKEQVRDKINELKARKDEELDFIILRNKYFRRSDRDTEEKRIAKIEKSRRESKNELENFCYR